MLVINTAGIFLVSPAGINMDGIVFGPVLMVPPPNPPAIIGLPLVLVKSPVNTPTGADAGESLEPPRD